MRTREEIEAERVSDELAKQREFPAWRTKKQEAIVPRLNEYISVGFCASYGDGDYRVSGEIAGLSKQRFNELKLTVLYAVQCAEETWRAAQPQEQAKMAADVPKS